MLGQYRRRWANIETALCECPVLGGIFMDIIMWICFCTDSNSSCLTQPCQNEKQESEVKYDAASEMYYFHGIMWVLNGKNDEVVVK